MISNMNKKNLKSIPVLFSLIGFSPSLFPEQYSLTITYIDIALGIINLKITREDVHRLYANAISLYIKD